MSVGDDDDNDDVLCSRDAVKSKCSIYEVLSTGAGTWFYLVVNRCHVITARTYQGGVLCSIAAYKPR